jgi:hypothetical protein
MAKYNSKDKCDICDAIRQIYALIQKCLKEDDKVLIDVADSVRVETVASKSK